MFANIDNKKKGETFHFSSLQSCCRVVVVKKYLKKVVVKVTLTIYFYVDDSLTYRVEEFCEFGEVIPPASVHHLDDFSCLSIG